MKRSTQWITLSIVAFMTIVMAENSFAGNAQRGGEISRWSSLVRFVSFETNYCRSLMPAAGAGIRCQTRLGDLSALEGRTFMVPSTNYSGGLTRISFSINQCTATRTTISCQKESGRIFSRR